MSTTLYFILLILRESNVISQRCRTTLQIKCYSVISLLNFFCPSSFLLLYLNFYLSFLLSTSHTTTVCLSFLSFPFFTSSLSSSFCFPSPTASLICLLSSPLRKSLISCIAKTMNHFPVPDSFSLLFDPYSMRYVTFLAAVDGVPGVKVTRVLSMPLKVRDVS